MSSHSLVAVASPRRAVPAHHQSSGQGLVEFALVLPLLLLLVFGIIESARLMASFSGASSGAKQGARYGSVSGTVRVVNGVSLAGYMDCAGIRNRVRAASPLMWFDDADIEISFTRGYITQTIGFCAAGAVTPTMSSPIQDGYQIVITTTAIYRPIVPIVPIPELPIRYVSARTIFTKIEGPTNMPPQDPDLAVLKGASQSVVAPNSSFYYSITVRNKAGSQTASFVTITDTLPSGINFSSVTPPSGWECSNSGQVVTCLRRSPMLTNTSSVININVTVASNATFGTRTNTVVLSAARTDRFPGDNTASANVLVQDGPDLALSKSGPSTVKIGERITYTLSLGNLGEEMEIRSGASIVITDTLPSDVTIVSWSLNNLHPMRSHITDCQNPIFTKLIVCIINGSNGGGGTKYPAGSPLTPFVTIVVQAPSYKINLTNQADVRAFNPTTQEGEFSNNTSFIITNVTDEVDLAITTAGVAPSTVLINRPATFYFQVSNINNAVPANGVALTATINGNGLGSVSGGRIQIGTTVVATCNPPTGSGTNYQVVCLYGGTLAVGNPPLGFYFDVQANNVAGGDVFGSAVVGNQGGQVDADLSNNNAGPVELSIDTCDPSIPDAANSQVTIAPSSTNADGSSMMLVSVTVYNDCDTPGRVEGSTEVTLASSRPFSDTITMVTSPYPSPTGQVSFEVRSIYPGTSTYTAQAKVGANTVNIVDTADGAFTTCNRADPNASTLTASPTEVPADGLTHSTITVNLRDSCGAAVTATTAVVLTSSRGALDTISLMSNTGGVATFRVTSATPGTSTYTAQATTTGAPTVTIVSTANVNFYGCITAVALPLGADAISFSLSNGESFNRRITSLTLNWITGGGQKVNTLTLGGVTIASPANPEAGNSPLTLSAFSASTNIAPSASSILAVSFDKALNSGNYSIVLNLDDGTGGRTCTASMNVTK